MQSVSDDDVQRRLLEKPRFDLAAKGVFRLGRWLHPSAGRSWSSGQQPGKHGYRRLIAWPMAPEDDWCLQRSDRLQEDCVLARAVQVTAVHFREELWMLAGRSYIRSTPKHATSEEWPTRHQCDRQIAGERSPVWHRSVPTVVAVRGMLVGQRVQHCRSPVLTVPMLPLVTGMWLVAPNDGSVWVLSKVYKAHVH